MRINAFTEGLYLDLRKSKSKVTVQALCPGFTYTEFHDTAGMDRGMAPKRLWMAAEDVVDESLEGVDRRKLFVVPGRKYRAIVAVVTKFPIWLRLMMESGAPPQTDR